MDWDKIEQLLDVVAKSNGHPQLKAITNMALKELAEHNVEAAPKPERVPVRTIASDPIEPEDEPEPEEEQVVKRRDA